MSNKMKTKPEQDVNRTFIAFFFLLHILLLFCFVLLLSLLAQLVHLDGFIWYQNADGAKESFNEEKRKRKMQ